MNFKLSKEEAGLVLTLRTDATYVIQDRLCIDDVEYEQAAFPLEGTDEFACEYSIKRNVFFFRRQDFFGGELDWDARFLLGELEVDPGDERYFRVAARKLGIDRDVLFHEEVELSPKCFCCGGGYQVSIFKHLVSVLPSEGGDIVIGGPREGALPSEAFLRLVESFPTKRELELYAGKRIAAIAGEYLGTARDYGEALDKLQMRHERALRERRHVEARGPSALHLEKREFFSRALSNMEDMLRLGDAVPEPEWQPKVADVLLALFPQYIALYPEEIVKGVPVHRGSFKRPDFLAVDAAGNVDVIEIKRAFGQDDLLRHGYRGNYVPAKELAGGVMQVEVYLSCMSNWGADGARELRWKLERKYPGSLPEGMSLTLAHSRGMLIVGQGAFEGEAEEDFNVIRRQYSRIIDIITYSDLIARLRRIAEQLWKSTSLVVGKDA